jgi:hypothetical protein
MIHKDKVRAYLYFQMLLHSLEQQGFPYAVKEIVYPDILILIGFVVWCFFSKAFFIPALLLLYDSEDDCLVASQLNSILRPIDVSRSASGASE